MADENYRSNRTGEAFARAAQPAYPNYAAPNPRSDQPSGDPLAELARLIGQNDPFADFGRPSTPREPAQHDPYAAPEPYAAHAHHPPGADYAAQPTHAQGYAADQGYAAPQPHGYQEHGYQEPSYREQGYQGQGYQEPYYGDRYQQPAFDDPHAAHSHSAPQQAYQPVHPAGYEHPSYEPQAYAGEPHPTQGYADQGYGSPAYAAAATDPVSAPYSADPFHAGERPMSVASDDMYEEDAPAPRGRRGLGAVAAVLTLALVGTGAAYGYRTLFSGSSGSKAPPPVIKADGTPNKVVPPSSSDAQSGKMTDRIGELAQGERVVSRQENPVDINTRPAQPRQVFPPLAGQQNGQTSGSSALASAQPTPTNAWAEPKRVRTEVIRPDRPIAPEVSAQQPITQASTRPAATAATVQTRSVAPPDSNAPLSLAPQQSGQFPPPARTRTAAVPPATTSGGHGAYVQVSSRGSEADAQASFRQLQAKFPNQLGGQSPVIRRADLGEKGVFFRAMVGPYASNEEATNMCVNLKAAGGQCVVQRN